MNKEDQVCSLELAEQLKKLNCKQESLWWWIVPGMGIEPYLADHKKKTTGEIYSAFTVAELGEMLPKYIDTDDRYWLTISCPIKDWKIGYWADNDCVVAFKSTQRNKTLTNAMAKMLIYLLENGLIKL